jgi:Na+/H+-dicarboxylate symporter
MKLYTKIFIGMAVGVAVGLLLGPNSLVAPKDTIRVSDGSSLRLMGRELDEEVSLPKGVEATFEVLGRVEDKGEAYYRLEMEVSPRQAIAAPELGKAGDTVEVHLPVEGAVRPVWSTGLTVMRVLEPVGRIFMRLIKMLIVPLVFCSLFVGVASLGDVRSLGRMGGKTLGFFMLTTVLAIGVGVVLGNVARPGELISEKDKKSLKAGAAASSANEVEPKKSPSTRENIVSIVPDSPLAAMAAKRPNMLQVIFFALILGVGATLVAEKHSKQVVSLLDKVNDALIMMIHICMAVAPFGVAALVAKVVGTSGWSVLGALAVYAVVVVVGLVFHAIFVYGAFVRLIAKIGLRDFWRVIRPAQLIAFSTSSSAAALPVAMEAAKDSMRIPQSTSSFVIPLGTTINMDGTALYQGVAALFIAQVFGVELGFGDQLSIILTATLASIGAAAVPGVGIITLAMVLTAVGIPSVGVALILGVDRILDMFRSAVNVTGNLAATAVISATEGVKPEVMSAQEDAEDERRGFERRLEVAQNAYEPGADEAEGQRAETGQGRGAAKGSEVEP